jgi:hypothetical protein
MEDAPAGRAALLLTEDKPTEESLSKKQQENLNSPFIMAIRPPLTAPWAGACLALLFGESLRKRRPGDSG